MREEKVVMNDILTASINAQTEKRSEEKVDKDDFLLFANFDVLTVRILQKFYGSSVNPVNGDINCYNVQQLYIILNKEGFKIGVEGLRKKLDFLVKVNFLEKINTYPRVYMTLKDIERIENVQRRIGKLRTIFL